MRVFAGASSQDLVSHLHNLAQDIARKYAASPFTLATVPDVYLCKLPNISLKRTLSLPLSFCLSAPEGQEINKGQD